MSKRIGMLAVLTAGLVSLAVTGCKKQQAAPTEAEVKKEVEQAAPALPAAQKPKDHPAH